MELTRGKEKALVKVFGDSNDTIYNAYIREDSWIYWMKLYSCCLYIRLLVQFCDDLVTFACVLI